MTRKKFESVLCHHCSPVLMGLKPSNLVSFPREEDGSLSQILREYALKLESEGVSLEVICSCRKHEMVLVYRQDMLKNYLSRKEVQNILRQTGYPVEGTLSDMLTCLEKRFSCHDEFPHEIGLFLGYPLEDVRGFQIYKGSNCKLCGYWKVYGDAEAARILFARFDRCREYLSRQISAGHSILQALKEAQSLSVPEARIA